MHRPPLVVVCGSLHLDVVVRAPRLPELDETAVGTARSFKCGGKGGNQAVMAARLGAPTAMIGRVGEDDFGRMLLANLDAAGVDRRGVGVDAQAGSGMSVALVVPDGNYAAVIVSGANLTLDPAAVSTAMRERASARVLLLQNEIPEAVNLAAVEAARASGMVTVLNAAPARPMSQALLDLVDVLVVNRIEAEALGGAPVRSPDDALRVGAALGRNSKSVIVTLGADGLVAFPPGADPVVIPARKVRAVSAHGAGDCFVGALAGRLARGDDLVAASRWSTAAAALFVSADDDSQARLGPDDVDRMVGGDGGPPQTTSNGAGRPASAATGSSQ